MSAIMKLSRLLKETAYLQEVSAINLSSDTKNTATNYVFIMIFLILALGYLIILVLIVYRGRAIFTKPQTILVSKIFYFLGFVLSAFRVISSVLLIIQSYNYDYENKDQNGQQQDNLAKLLFNGLYISDVLFGLMFFSLFWYIIVYNYKSHVRVGNVLEDGKNPAASIKGLNIYTYIMIVYTMIHVVFICLYNLGYDNLLNSSFYISCICINNAISIIYFVIGTVILNFKFSGTPYKTNKLQTEMNHLERMAYFWLFGRCFEIALDILVIVNSQQISDLIVGKQQDQGIFWSVISYFILPANYIIAEVIPLLYSLVEESVKIFSKNPYQTQESQILLDENDNPIPDELSSSANKDQEEQVGKTQKQSFDSDIQDTNIIKINKQSKFIKQIEKKERRKGFGYIQKVLHENKKKARKAEQEKQIDFRKSETSQKSGQIGLIDDYEGYNQLAFRILPIRTLSSWILQEVNQDIYNMKRIHLKNISKVVSIATDNDQVCLISRYYQHGSLYDMLPKNVSIANSSKSSSLSILPNATDVKGQQKNDQLGQQLLKKLNIHSTYTDYQLEFKFSHETKMRISIQIAKTMAKLHKIGIFHGHLSSSNILFDKNFDVKISDIGLISLKKLMSIRYGYQNKTHFTAPEHLEEASLIVKNATSKSDIYSFAFILWELFMEREAFGRLNLEDLKKTIINDNSRPKIPENGPIPKEVATIIRYCWLANPQERPEFGVILANLKRINNESLDDDEEFIFDEQEQKLTYKDNDQLQKQYKEGFGIDSDEYEDNETKFRQLDNNLNQNDADQIKK